VLGLVVGVVVWVWGGGRVFVVMVEQRFRPKVAK
jgi:hypothetical protein